jgi:hypothetical protein
LASNEFDSLAGRLKLTEQLTIANRLQQHAELWPRRKSEPLELSAVQQRLRIKYRWSHRQFFTTESDAVCR